MNRTIENIISFFMWLILPFAVYNFVFVRTHWEMVKEDYNVKKLKKSSFKDFLEKANGVDWECRRLFPDSLFSSDDAGYFHASIIRFNDVGYLMTPLGYIRAKLYVKNKIKELGGGVPLKPYVN